MRSLVLAFCLLASSAAAQTPVDRPAPKLLITAAVATLTLDAATTHVVLGRGGREVNPIMSQRALVNDVVIGAQAVALGVVTAQLAKQGHPRVAKWMLIGSIAFRGAIVAHNVRVLQLQGRR